MNRRDFLNFLGIGATITAINPALLLPASPAVEVFSAYPRLYFTGLKCAQTSLRMAGQFLWAVDWIGEDDRKDRTHWYCNVMIDLYDIERKNAEEIVRFKLQQSALEVVRMMDGIIEDAHLGKVQTGRYEQVDNPYFDPALPETIPYADDQPEIDNYRYVQGPPIVARIKSMRFPQPDEHLSFDYGISPSSDAWEIEKLTAMVMEQLNSRRSRARA